VLHQIPLLVCVLVILTRLDAVGPGRDHHLSSAVLNDLDESIAVIALVGDHLFRFVLGQQSLSLPAELGVACKYPFSWDQIHKHVSKGYKRITQNGYEGLVCIGLDLLMFNGMSNFMDFRQTGKPPLEIMEKATGEVMTNLVKLRARDYPSEKPINGAMMTMSAVGIYGRPAHSTSVRYATLQCDRDNPRFADFGVLYKRMIES
jgi:hypothetical protein